MFMSISIEQRAHDIAIKVVDKQLNSFKLIAPEKYTELYIQKYMAAYKVLKNSPIYSEK